MRASIETDYTKQGKNKWHTYSFTHKEGEAERMR